MDLADAIAALKIESAPAPRDAEIAVLREALRVARPHIWSYLTADETKAIDAALKVESAPDPTRDEHKEGPR